MLVSLCNLMKFPTGHEANLFTGRGKNYITLVDYFSDFVEVNEIEDTTSHAVIQVLKQQFSRHGIPHTVVSDTV